MDHCIYCGAEFPPDFRQGLPEPEALKWVDRPGIPPEAARQLEIMKVIPLDGARRPRSLGRAITLLSVPVFAVIFYLLYSLVHHNWPSTAGLVLLGGAVFVAYLIWNVFKAPPA
jgi:hypothetical protein